MPNQLAGETSPYLLQHAGNPVDWWPWGEQALTLARRAGKPILLSIGYSACHWCHVMAHESFEDAETAAVMNDLFVNIKVDREERPDLDQIYQTAHQLLTGRAGGWPLTLFLTPDGTPFFAGTYFPDAPRHGMPAFVSVCRQIADVYRRRPEAVAEQNRALHDALASLAGPSADHDPGIASTMVEAGRNLLVHHFDPRFGGFGGAPKFPHATDLALLLRMAARGDAEARTAAVTTLTRMAEGGLYDQLGGGFFRYSVDERWQIPHFEKMLYDNALLLGVYADAWALTGDALFARVVEETAAWAVREMQLPGGGFASSLDADSEGEEGRFYVWQADEVRALLPAAEWRVAASAFGLEEPPNFENRHWHLTLVQRPAEAAATVLASARARLLAQRDQRVRPGLDDKVLTAWNALMVEGLAHAARVFDRPSWLAAARRAFDFIRGELRRDGRLLATWREGRAHLPAYLDDHAFLLGAAIELLQADFRSSDLDLAVELADTLLARFEDAPTGGFFFTADDHEVLIQRPKPVHDNALPGGNAAAALNLRRLGDLLGERRYLDAAERAVRLFAAGAPGGGAATLLTAVDELLAPPPQIILRGPPDRLRSWALRLARRSACGLVLSLANDIGPLRPEIDKPHSDDVTAWVCFGSRCLPPVTDFDQLSDILDDA
jgi:uncharacterized protein YyaL (SSP411 family)